MKKYLTPASHLLDLASFAILLHAAYSPAIISRGQALMVLACTCMSVVCGILARRSKD